MAYDFDKIARTYDRLNHVMTLGLDRRWRKRAVKGLHGNVLDVACGTGDMMVSLTERGCTVTGVDISEEMLEIARSKLHPSVSCADSSPVSREQLGETCSSPETGEVPEGRRGGLIVADAEHLPFADGEFDAVTCAFGVRNFVHLEKGLSEMLRVLKPGGTMVILELATPDSKLLCPFYNFYTRHIIPWLGSRLASSREAYTYLPESIERFPKGNDFLKIVHHSLPITHHSSHRKFTFGVCRLYVINKEAAG